MNPPNFISPFCFPYQKLHIHVYSIDRVIVLLPKQPQLTSSTTESKSKNRRNKQKIKKFKNVFSKKKSFFLKEAKR